MPFHLDAESLLATFSPPFPDIDFLMHFGRPLAHFWLPFGSFWLPLAPFWLPLAPFWHPLAHFWRPLAPFWLTFDTPWLTFDALGLISDALSFDDLTFGSSSCQSPYLFIFYKKIICKIIFSEKWYCESDQEADTMNKTIIELIVYICIFKSPERNSPNYIYMYMLHSGT